MIECSKGIVLKKSNCVKVMHTMRIPCFGGCAAVRAYRPLIAHLSTFELRDLDPNPAYVADLTVCACGAMAATHLDVYCHFLSTYFLVVGGIYTVIKSKAPDTVATLGQTYW